MKEISHLKEYTALLKIRVFHTGGAYTFNIETGARRAKNYIFRGDHDAFVRFLMGIKAKDNKTWPRSVRGERYSDIADEIENGSDQIIYVWEHDYMRYINRISTKKSEAQKMVNWDDLIDILWDHFKDYLRSTDNPFGIYVSLENDRVGKKVNVKLHHSSSSGEGLTGSEVDQFIRELKKVQGLIDNFEYQGAMIV